MVISPSNQLLIVFEQSLQGDLCNLLKIAVVKSINLLKQKQKACI